MIKKNPKEFFIALLYKNFHGIPLHFKKARAYSDIVFRIALINNFYCPALEHRDERCVLIEHRNLAARRGTGEGDRAALIEDFLEGVDAEFHMFIN